MVRLSLKLKDRFSRAMLDAEPFSLGARDAAILGAFTFMKAVITDHLINPNDPFFTRAAWERFRASLTPSPLKIWFAAFQGRSRISTRNNLSLVSTSEPGPLYGVQFCSHTYVVGNLALQLLAPRWKHIRDRGRPLISLRPDAYWDQAVTLFWPHDQLFRGLRRNISATIRSKDLSIASSCLLSSLSPIS